MAGIRPNRRAGLGRAGTGVRQHDPFGPFRVESVKPEHPIMRGMADFDTQDELYTCLTGDHPIEVLAQAKSKVDGKYYPMAFVSHYGQGRTFHCVPGPRREGLERAGGAGTLSPRLRRAGAGLPPAANQRRPH